MSCWNHAGYFIFQRMMLSGLEMKLALILVIGPTYCVFKIPNLY